MTTHYLNEDDFACRVAENLARMNSQVLKESHKRLMKVLEMKMLLEDYQEDQKERSPALQSPTLIAGVSQK